MAHETILQQRQIWQTKPVLRAIYNDYYERIARACRPGLSLEIGGGSGNLKEYLPDVLSTDIVAAPWLDAAADAQSLPFLDACFNNVVSVDVLHHIETPRRFLAEVQRILKPEGRLVFLEPAITPGSWAFYKYFHPEPFDCSVDPLHDTKPSADRDPFEANQAIPGLLVGRYRDRVAELFPALRLVSVAYLSLWAYPLSGGFRKWCLLPRGLVRGLLKTENLLSPWLGELMGFRVLSVLRRTSDG